MARMIFWFGALITQMPWIAEAWMGDEVTAANEAAVYAYATCVMIFGVGLHILHPPTKKDGT